MANVRRTHHRSRARSLAGLFHELFNSNRQTDPFADLLHRLKHGVAHLTSWLSFQLFYPTHKQATGGKKGSEKGKGIQKYMSVDRPMRKFAWGRILWLPVDGTSGDTTMRRGKGIETLET